MSFIWLFGMLQLRQDVLLWSPFLMLQLSQIEVLCDYYFVILGSFVFSYGLPKMAKWLCFALPAFLRWYRLDDYSSVCWGSLFLHAALLPCLVFTCDSPDILFPLGFVSAELLRCMTQLPVGCPQCRLFLRGSCVQFSLSTIFLCVHAGPAAPFVAAFYYFCFSSKSGLHF